MELIEDWAFEWLSRLKAERAVRNLTPRQYDALEGMAFFLEREGRWPSDAEAAVQARCGISTVGRARKAAQALGLLEWTHTRQLVGDRWRQGRNVYRASVPAAPVVVRPDIQIERARRRKKEREASKGLNKTVPQQLAMLPAVSVDLLAARRAVMAARIAG